MNKSTYHNHPMVGKILQFRPDCHHFWKNGKYDSYMFKIIEVYELSGKTLAWCNIYSLIPGREESRVRNHQMKQKSRVNVDIEEFMPSAHETNNESSKFLLEKEW